MEMDVSVLSGAKKSAQERKFFNKDDFIVSFDLDVLLLRPMFRAS